jgi:hypothetical protein
VARQHGLDGPVAHHVAVQSLGSPFPDEVLEMGERLGEREPELVVAEVFWEDPMRDLEGRCRSPIESGVHHRKPFLVVPQKLIDASVEVVEKRPVSREDEIHTEASQAFEGSHVAL